MSGKKILICEDDIDCRQALKNILLKRGYEVSIAVNGEESIEKVKELKPDLLLIDIRMPKLNGIEAVEEIRKFNTEIKIIFITAFESPQLSKEATKYNIYDYIVKPPEPEYILDTVHKALQ